MTSSFNNGEYETEYSYYECVLWVLDLLKYKGNNSLENILLNLNDQ